MFHIGTMKYMELMPVMPVKLINYSEGEHGDLLQEVAYCARVSNPSNQDNPNDLYQNGLQRQKFIKSINIFADKIKIFKLEGDIDYRTKNWNANKFIS